MNPVEANPMGLNPEQSDLRGDVLREPLPNKDTDENTPEELNTLLLHEDLLATVQGVKELHDRKQVREDDVGGVDEERAHDASQAIA